jgi:bifunctional DNase/RNase
MGDQSPTVSSRPSDAIALAARLGTSLYVADDLLDAEGVVLQTEDADEDTANPEELVGEFRQFLQNIRPEDFSS